ncbi:MAG: Holliday junction branch migration protein RuvA [Parcubacteria group bacterium]|nr:Holliday junction branch migration protein RuvA [Parcubacteria group bacterium]
MISTIEGQLKEKNGKSVILETGGIGYEIFVSSRTLKELNEFNHSIKLWTFLSIREDRMELYGFLNKEELDFFHLLDSVAGVGPKGALAILGLSDLTRLKAAVFQEDSKFLTKVAGIGKKTAERIILELKNKIKDIENLPALESDHEILDALVELGYSAREAKAAIEKIPDEAQGLEPRLKSALKSLSKK